jgi:hypothetical protein
VKLAVGRRLLLAWLAVMAPLAAVAASAPVELSLLAERVVDGMPSGNLSGLAWCAGALWTVSDRDDDRLYQLTETSGVLQAQAELFSVPPLPYSGLSWGVRARNWLSAQVRGGELDFEGLSCDAAGNRYLVSESQVAVLQITAEGHTSWLNLPLNLLQQAHARGMLWTFNALFEGLALDSAGERLWLAAERQNRGLLRLHNTASGWRCKDDCVLLSEAGALPAAAQLGGELLAKDFADLQLFHAKLFTLERSQQQICRRSLEQAQIERCWSYADTELAASRHYEVPYGVAEALWIDADGAWVGVDNGEHVRADGEVRPIVWRFAVPAGGWDAAP